MDILQAFVLGILEGITEFLPVSSTGHLIVGQDLLGYKDTGKMFAIVIQIGAIAAVVWFYRHHLIELVKGIFNGDKALRKFWLVWVLATIPAGIAGIIFSRWFDSYAVSLTVAVALILGGVAMWLVEEYHNSPTPKTEPQLNKISFGQSIKIGSFQVLALIPGVSRSGATIIGGMLSGLDRVTATAFSFYLSMPVIIIAGGYKLATGDISTVEGGAPALIVGLITAFFSSLLVIKWLLRFVAKNNFKIFAYYRIGLGCVILLLIAFGVIGT